jgi:stage V sporulation protein B
MSTVRPPSPAVLGEPAPTVVSAPAPDRAVEAGRGALFIGVAKVFFMLSGFIQQVVLARLVNAAGLGAFGAVNSAISMVNNTVVQATIQSVSKFSAEDDERAPAVTRAALEIQIVVGALLGLGFFLGAPAIADFVKAPGYVRYFRIAAAIPFLYAIYAVFIGAVNGRRRFRTQAGFDMTFSVAKTVLLLGGAAVAGVAGAFAGFVLAALFIVVVAIKVIGTGPAAASTPTSTFPVSRLVKFMLAVGAYNLFLNIELLYDQPLLHRFAGQVDPTRAAALAGQYQALRTLALLPYQALLVVTFVIFPLVSRSTFAEDRSATRAYVTQTLRYALILATAMGLALGARPGALVGILYPAAYAEGARALPILVVGECCLALLAVTCAILNAAGRAIAALSLMAGTVVTGVTAAFVLVPRAALGPEMLTAAAVAASLGMALGLLASIVYVRMRMGGSAPLATVGRVVISGAAAVLAGSVLPLGGKLTGLAIIGLVTAIYLGGLIGLGEFGPTDRAKFRKVLRRG